ncbi:hypothetical protein HS088_TW07G00582 [Tripterygium wilfordii]|uniref:Uncharacterized protein n=1 Tax=Tripterygium wilfordii TaxID=458696 RepID=A0A7J7DFB9_TRIWF|nr:hypothetical protein HS088_TW07G00582 [Tripterygium wilfordii]
MQVRMLAFTSTTLKKTLITSSRHSRTLSAFSVLIDSQKIVLLPATVYYYLSSTFKLYCTLYYAVLYRNRFWFPSSSSLLLRRYVFCQFSFEEIILCTVRVLIL